MTRAARLAEYLESHIRTGDFPGASYLVAEESRVLAEGALGSAVVRPQRIAATTGTLYDLASLTKPLAGALVAALLESERLLAFDDPLWRHVTEWPRHDAAGGVTLLDLLTHRSGLPAWYPLYIHATDRPSCAGWLARQPLERPPRTRVVYSDPGYILLGLALERAAGARLDGLFSERVTRPLGLTELMFRPAPALRSRIAATEAGNLKERLLAGPEADRYNGWRTEVAWGEPHDLNAAMLEGVSAHAGLFGTARAVHSVAQEFLGRGSGLLGDRSRGLFGTSLTAGLGQDRSLGFLLATEPGVSAGEEMSRGAFGHTGFTGTSLWIDPDARRIYVLLTNRVHPEFKEIDMNAIRRGFHELAASV